MSALSQAELDDLAHVLHSSGVSGEDVEQWIGSLADTAEPEAVADILLARRPERAAWFAPMSGYLNQVGSALLLTEETTPAGEYVPEKFRTDEWEAGGAVYRVLGERRAWRFGSLDGRALRVPVGSRVEAGEVLTDGAVDLHDLLRQFGRRKAPESAANRLASVSSLDLPAARELLRPLFDAVRVFDGGGFSDLSAGVLCTMSHFVAAQWRAFGRALRDLPASADSRLHAVAAIHDDVERREAVRKQKLYSVLKAVRPSFDFPAGCPAYVGCTELAILIDQGGVVPPGVRHDVGTFEVVSETLRLADPCLLKPRTPQFDRFVGATLPAQAGKWRAFSFVANREEAGPRVVELRMWLDGQAMTFGIAADDTFTVLVDSGMAGCFDLGEPDRIDIADPDLVHAIRQQLAAAGPALAVVLNDRGVVAEAGCGDGRYRGRAWRGPEATVIAVALELGNWAD